jgi:hypothetical protein
MRNGYAAITRTIMLLAVLIVGLAGCGGGGGGGSAATGPTISSVQVLPDVWSSGGGDATIEADVTDSKSITSVAAVVTLPDGTKSAEIVLTQDPSDPGRYDGQYAVPANTVLDGPAQTYSVVVTAADTAASTNTSRSPVTFTVPAPTSPPVPP